MAPLDLRLLRRRRRRFGLLGLRSVRRARLVRSLRAVRPRDPREAIRCALGDGQRIAARAERGRLGLTAIDPAHRCAVGCTTVGCRRVRVCVASLDIHRCPGPGCRFARTTSEGTVCGLSGYEIAGPADSVVSSYSRDNGVTATSCRHWGHADRSARASARRAPPRETDQLTRVAVENHVTLFLASRLRGEIYRAELAKVEEACVKAAKTSKAPLSIDAVMARTAAIYTERADLCRRPADPTLPWLGTLAMAIFEFWKGLRDKIEMKRKNAPAFVATVLSCMAGPGLAIGGVCFIPQSAIVRRHCPRPRQFGSFRGKMTCRRVTQHTRFLKSALTLPSGSPRMVPALVFGD